MYALQLDFDSIKQRYFDGQSGLFPGSAHTLTQLVERAEKLVNVYNRNQAADLELLDSAPDGSGDQGSATLPTIDLLNLRGRTHGVATGLATYLVDMAKAEALDTLGETVKAAQLVEKHA